jgi:hypothetical protein
LSALLAIAGLAIILFILWDAFETTVLPRRVTRSFRLTRFFYRSTWIPSSAIARRLPPGRIRNGLLSAFGPLSLILLFAFWAFGLIVGFAFLHAAAGTPGSTSFGTSLYMSGTTFFTLGLGDVTPRSPLGRVVTVAESGIGFGFLAVVIGYLPVIYGAFSRRETNISLLDARAGSPPTARALISHYGQPENLPSFVAFLRDWEAWTAELMESHLSYPVLCYYRSQHDNQSWLAALTTILDTCSLVAAHVDGEIARQARLTFAMARHAVVDLSQVLKVPPHPATRDRLSHDGLAAIRADLKAAGVVLCEREEAEKRLTEFRRLYEPYVCALADRLLISIPAWARPAHAANWQTSAWEKAASEAPAREAGEKPEDAEHH